MHIGMDDILNSYIAQNVRTPWENAHPGNKEFVMHVEFSSPLAQGKKITESNVRKRLTPTINHEWRSAQLIDQVCLTLDLGCVNGDFPSLGMDKGAINAPSKLLELYIRVNKTCQETCEGKVLVCTGLYRNWLVPSLLLHRKLKMSLFCDKNKK